MGPNNPFSTRDIFWENWLSLLCTCCVLSYYSTSKKLSETKWWKSLHHFAPNLAWVDFSIRNKFIGKVDQHFIGLLYPVMLRNFKKILWEQIIRLYNFCRNCCFPQKISWKIDWCLTIALHYAKMFLKISRAVNTSCVILGRIGPILLQREIFVHHATKFQKDSQSHGT